jgi:hypothetical protein
VRSWRQGPNYTSKVGNSKGDGDGDAWRAQLMNWIRCSQSHAPATMDAARVCCGARTMATI